MDLEIGEDVFRAFEVVLLHDFDLAESTCLCCSKSPVLLWVVAGWCKRLFAFAEGGLRPGFTFCMLGAQPLEFTAR